MKKNAKIIIERIKDIADEDLIKRVKNPGYCFFMKEDLIVECQVSYKCEKRTEQKVTYETWRSLSIYEIKDDQLVRIGSRMKWRHFGTDRYSGDFGKGRYRKEIKKIEKVRDSYRVTFIDDDYDYVEEVKSLVG